MSLLAPLALESLPGIRAARRGQLVTLAVVPRWLAVQQCALIVPVIGSLVPPSPGTAGRQELPPTPPPLPRLSHPPDPCPARPWGSGVPGAAAPTPPTEKGTSPSPGPGLGAPSPQQNPKSRPEAGWEGSWPHFTGEGGGLADGELHPTGPTHTRPFGPLSQAHTLTTHTHDTPYTPTHVLTLSHSRAHERAHPRSSPVWAHMYTCTSSHTHALSQRSHTQPTPTLLRNSPAVSHTCLHTCVLRNAHGHSEHTLTRAHRLSPTRLLSHMLHARAHEPWEAPRGRTAPPPPPCYTWPQALAAQLRMAFLPSENFRILSGCGLPPCKPSVAPSGRLASGAAPG